MTTREMKRILANKLELEGTYFEISDITIRTTPEGIRIVIKDYEHIPFILTTEEDDYFGKCVVITTPEGYEVVFRTSKKDYDYEGAILELGYYIGTRF